MATTAPPIDPVDAAARALVDLLWTPTLTSKKRLFNGDSARDLTNDDYIDYYKRQWHLVAGHANGRYVALQSPRDLNKVIQLLGTHSGLNRADTLAEVETRLGVPHIDDNDESWINTLNLAARMLLMLKVGVVKGQALPRRYLRWLQTGDSLESVVKEYFDVPPVLSSEQVRLPTGFDAWGLSVMAGIEIEFTDNLADHLLWVDEEDKVLIFHHVSFLETLPDNAIFPPGFIDETLRTLALLFPQSEYSSRRGSARRSGTKKRKWFSALRENTAKKAGCVLDRRLTLCGKLQAEDRQIERFTFWRDRLVILKQAFDDSNPRTMSQWWHDRRNGVQWYTFWVALVVLVLTFLFGLIQSIEGAMQVYVAYNTRERQEAT